MSVLQKIRENWLGIRLFTHLIRLTLVLSVLGALYWLLLASDRYVSETSLIIRKTDSVNAPSLDISMLVSGVGGVNRSDQLLLREYLLSVDMLNKLDAALHLREHYSNHQHDLLSRMWFQDASIEWFHRYYLSRVSVEYDDFAGVLRIDAQAFDAETAQAIAHLLVQEGERYMNQLGHELAQAQVDFLTTQVNLAQLRFQQARQALLQFQNNKGLVSPQGTVETISTIIAKLEEQRSQLTTQIASLPKTISPNHPNLLLLKQSLAAIDRQIADEKSRLASASGHALNSTAEEFQRLQMEATFTQDLYKAALTTLEKGRMDATRMLEKVSVLQAPTHPEYPMQPRRLYNTLLTLLGGLMLAGILKLLESIIRDHID